jgi:superfamily II DNA or RNA helicase
MNLRPYQQDAIEAVRNAYRSGHRAPLLVLPTGGGKTVIFTHITKAIQERGKRVMILLHRVELVRQTSRALSVIGVEHGVIHRAYKPQYYQPVQVCSVGSLVRRLNHISPPDLIIIDEAHHAPAGTWQTILQAYQDAHCLGVTATPIRSDGRGLANMFDTLIVGADVQQLIDGGYLVQPRCYSVDLADLGGVKKTRGDYDKAEVAELLDKPRIVGDVVATYRKLADGLPAVVFCVTVAHAEHVAREFRAAGYRAYSADGSMSDEDRQRVIDGLGNGYTQVLCTCDLISEGTDIPAIAAAIMLRPTMSEGLYIQQVGRALRPVPGKLEAIIIDHVGNVRKHGLPDDLREWQLTNDKVKTRGAGKEATIRVTMCLNCFSAFNPAPVCPTCGTPVEVKKVAPQVVDGELIEITRAERKAARMEVGMARTLDDLRAIARDRGYKNGWVWRMAQLKGIK